MLCKSIKIIYFISYILSQVYSFHPLRPPAPSSFNYILFCYPCDFFHFFTSSTDTGLISHIPVHASSKWP